MAERSLAAYLTLPRPDEARAKAPLALLGYGLVHTADVPGDGVPLATALVAWAIFELVLYQARYMLNDLADADVDRLHVAAEARARLPVGARARRWSIGVLTARIALALVVMALLPDPARGIMLVAALGVAAATAAYEAVRAPMRRGSRSLKEKRPHRALFLQRSGALAVMVLVGAGYAIRVGFGVALAGADGPVVGAAVVLGWLFGTTGVVMAWLLEAAGLREGGDETVRASKAHIATIVDLIGDDPAHIDRPILRGGGARLTAGLLAASTAAAVALGVALGGSPGVAPLVALLGLTAVAVPILLVAWPSPWAGVPAVVVALAAAGGLATADGRDEMLLLLAVVVTTVAVARTFTPATIDLNPSAAAPSAGTAAAPPAAPAGASPAATTARPAPARGHDGAAARSHPGSEPAARR